MRSVLVLLAAVACTGGEPAAEPEAPVPLSDEDTLLEQLESLGYIDASEDVADPDKMGVTLHRPEVAWDGLNLYCMRSVPRADLLDMDGSLVHRWTVPTDREWTSCRMLPDGSLVVVGLEQGKSKQRRDRSRFIARYAWDGSTIWRNDGLRAHHETDVGADGTVYALALRYERDPALIEDGWVRDDEVVALDGQGTVVRRVALSAILSEGDAPVGLVPPAPEDKWGLNQIDMVHANTVDLLEGPAAADHPVLGAGQLLVTSRHQSMVFAFEPDTRALRWAWGRGELLRPHEGQLLDNGNVLIFDNGGKDRPHSRVLEVRPTGARTAEVVFQWPETPDARFFSDSRGGVQRLPNGNTLVTDSNAGRAFELLPDGTLAWEFWNPVLAPRDRRRTFRKLHRVPREWVPGAR